MVKEKYTFLITREDITQSGIKKPLKNDYYTISANTGLEFVFFDMVIPVHLKNHNIIENVTFFLDTNTTIDLDSEYLQQQGTSCNIILAIFCFLKK